MERYPFLGGEPASPRQMAGHGNLGLRKSPPVPAKNKASHVQLGVPMWACEGAVLRAPSHPQPGCGTELPRPMKAKGGMEQRWPSWQQKAGAQFQGSLFLQGHTPQLPDPGSSLAGTTDLGTSVRGGSAESAS